MDHKRLPGRRLSPKRNTRLLLCDTETRAGIRWMRHAQAKTPSDFGLPAYSRRVGRGHHPDASLRSALVTSRTVTPEVRFRATSVSLLSDPKKHGALTISLSDSVGPSLSDEHQPNIFHGFSTDRNGMFRLRPAPCCVVPPCAFTQAAMNSTCSWWAAQGLNL